MRSLILFSVAGVLGFVSAILTEPVAFTTNTCYHNEIHQGILVEAKVSMTNSPGWYPIGLKQDIRSWSEFISMYYDGVHLCEEDDK